MTQRDDAREGVNAREGLLCDRCRKHCWAVDTAKTYHRLIDVYGVAEDEVPS